MLVTALALLALARVGTLLPSRVLALTAAATAVLPWAYSVADGFGSATDEQTAAHLWGHAAVWPLVAAVVLAGTCGVISGLHSLTRPGCAVAALLAGYVVALPVLDNGATSAVTSLLRRHRGLDCAPPGWRPLPGGSPQQSPPSARPWRRSRRRSTCSPRLPTPCSGSARPTARRST